MKYNTKNFIKNSPWWVKLIGISSLMALLYNLYWLMARYPEINTWEGYVRAYSYFSFALLLVLYNYFKKKHEQSI